MSKEVHIGSSPYLTTLSGIAAIKVVQSATTGAGAATWAIRNGTTTGKTLFIRKIWMQFIFSGTGAATEMQYEWIKGASCTAMSGGTAVTPLLRTSRVSHGDVDVRVLDTGLTQTGISMGSSFWIGGYQRVTHAATQTADTSSNIFELDFGAYPIELQKNEVLTLRQLATSVIGDTVLGGVDFYGG